MGRKLYVMQSRAHQETVSCPWQGVWQMWKDQLLAGIVQVKVKTEVRPKSTKEWQINL